MLAPKQPTLVCVPMLLVNAAAGCSMLALLMVLQPLASVMVQVQMPAGRLFAVAPFCTGEVFQLKLYGAVPPLAFTVAMPVLAPKQFTLVCAPMLLASAAAGCVMFTFRVVLQPLASVMVQVQVPVGRLFAVASFCTGEVFQLKL